jgi:hypothetical protein
LTREEETHPVQQYINVAPSIDNSGVTAQLHDFAEHADELVLELLEMGGEDSGGLWVVHCVSGARVLS